MPKIIPPNLRRKVIEFDPWNSNMSVSEFCRKLKISRRSFYTIRKRYATNPHDALLPRSSAPKNPHRIYDERTTNVIVNLRKELRSSGLDAGPISIRLAGIERGLFPADKVPSPATIARTLKKFGLIRKGKRG